MFRGCAGTCGACAGGASACGKLRPVNLRSVPGMGLDREPWLGFKKRGATCSPLLVIVELFKSTYHVNRAV